MSVADMSGFIYQNIMDPSLLANPDDPAELSSCFDETYPFGIAGDNFADAPQADATFDLDDFDFNRQATPQVDVGFAIPNTPQSSFPDQRYVSLPSQSQADPSSVWHPLEQPEHQFYYPNPDFSSHPSTILTPYYPLPPLQAGKPMTQHNFRAITPPGQQLSSIDRSLFLHGNVGGPSATAGLYPYEPIQTYQDNGAFTPEDMALSDLPEDLVATAFCEGWALPGDNTPQQQGSRPNDLYVPDICNYDSDADICDAPESGPDYKLSSSPRAKRARRTNPSRPQAILPNGEVKKGRPCAKPQTEERKRVNQRRMEGYYKRKHDQKHLDKARQQSRESYWRRKQRRIEAGEKVRSYNASKKGKSEKKM